MNDCIAFQYYSSPLGELILGVYQDQLCLLDWRYRKARAQIDNRICSHLKAPFKLEDHPLMSETIAQLTAYFDKQRTTFELPLLPIGSPFQLEVWQQLLKIPYGQTLSYQELSEQLGNQLAIRAVAAANGANALSIVIPCHRIIGSKGELIGYAGGLEAKRKLLSIENALAQGSLF